MHVSSFYLRSMEWNRKSETEDLNSKLKASFFIHEGNPQNVIKCSLVCFNLKMLVFI